MRAVAVFTMLLASTLCAQERSNSLLDRFFQLPGIELTEQQTQEISALQETLGKKLRESQQTRNDIYTKEQRQAMQEAIAAARKAGKSGPQVRAVDAAVKLDKEQQEQLNRLQRERNAMFAKVRSEIQALLTPEQRQKLAARRPPGASRQAIKPTHADLKYGPADRNVMDVWLADSKRPTPVLVSIHGGGFRGGNKSISSSLLRQCLDSGISAVAITYRLTDEAIAPAQMMDAARAIQFIRHNAKEWNLDPTRIAATGGSAGAGISLWLGFHDDLADPDNEDPVLRQSTRLTCMYVSGGQTSYDPRFIRKMFPDSNVYKHPALFQLYDADLNKLDELPKQKYELFEQVSPINFLTKDDAPAILSYGMALDDKPDIHHPLFGKLLKEKMDKMEIRCEVYAGQEVLGGGERLSIIDFIKEEFGMK